VRAVVLPAALVAAALVAAALSVGAVSPMPPAQPLSAVGTGTAATSAATESAGDGAESAIPPVDFAVVVDESGSLTADDVANEKAAVALVAQSDPSRQSRAIVIGFGGEAPGHSPVDEVCPLTVLDRAGRQALGGCLDELHRRGPTEGNGTDFPAAIRQATRRLTAAGGPDTPKLIFLLTDGKLDVSDSPSYGTDLASRNANGAQSLDDELGKARDAKVQVWPLGFGSQPDPTQLQHMAAGGDQLGCSNLPSARPRMRVVKGSAEVSAAAQQAFAWARCLGISTGSHGIPPVDLRVTIPPVATDGAITVVKQDPAVVVRYYDPDNHLVPTSGEFDGSRFEASGQDSPVEALQITDPVPGTWRVNLSVPDGHPKRVASVSVIWKGVLRSSLTLTPAAPIAGERTVVQMRLQTRRGVVITDPEQLRGITVGVELSGPSIAEPIHVPLHDDGQAPDDRAHDGSFAAYLTVPDTATGNVDLLGEMLAQGVTGDRRPYPTQIVPRPPRLIAKAILDDHAVHPGASVRGTLTARNNDTSPHTLGLVVMDAGPRPISVEGVSFTVRPGADVQLPFKVLYGKGVPLGPSSGRISVVDRSDADRELSSTFLTVTVKRPPTWLERWWWALLAGVAVVALAVWALLAWLQVHRERVGAGDLELVLRHGNRVGTPLRTGRDPGRWYRFEIVDRASDPRLERRKLGSYWVRRVGDGRVTLRTPGRRKLFRPRLGEPLQLGEDLELLVRDLRAGRSGANARRNQARRPRTQPEGGRFPSRLRRPGGTAPPARRNGDGGFAGDAGGVGSASHEYHPDL